MRWAFLVRRLSDRAQEDSGFLSEAAGLFSAEVIESWVRQTSEVGWASWWPGPVGRLSIWSGRGRIDLRFGLVIFYFGCTSGDFNF